MSYPNINNFQSDHPRFDFGIIFPEAKESYSWDDEVEIFDTIKKKENSFEESYSWDEEIDIFDEPETDQNK